jgi:cell wall-associated NlpC family hydrolase
MAAKPGIAASGFVSEGFGEPVPFSPGVQGLNSVLEDLVLEGRSWRAVVGDAVVNEAELVRSVDGASTVDVEIIDDERKLLNSPLLASDFDVVIDDLWFSYVKLSNQGLTSPLKLTFEDREVRKMKQAVGPYKVKKDKLTFPQFAQRLVRKIKPRIPFYCPALQAKSPITNARAGRKNAQGKLLRREQGLNSKANITVKGAKADPGQIRNIERVLDVGVSLKAPEAVLVTAIVVGIVENLCRHGSGGDRDSNGFFQQRPSQGWGPPAELEEDASDFYKGRGGNQGALALYQRGTRDPAALAQAVQRSGTPGAYSQYVSEARKAVSAYLGGAEATAAGASATTATEKLQWERKKKESTWACIGRYAEEINWRWYVSNGIAYLLAETDLLRSKSRNVISDQTPGVTDIRFDYDKGKPVDEVTVSAWTRSWGTPPGTVIELERHGPANGRYIVGEIRSTLRHRNSIAEITLRRPEAATARAKKEKTKGKKSKSVRRSAGSTNDQVARMAAEIDRIDKLRLNYQWGGGHSTPAPRNGPFDCSSFVSRVLQAAGINIPTMVSGSLARWGAAGSGQGVKIVANSQHVFMAVKVGGEWRFAGTSPENPGGGPGWHSSRSSSGFSVRHPPGL